MTLLTSALSYIFAPFIGIGLMLSSALEPVQESAPLGASEAIPTTIAFFETTLASAITDTATSFNLTSATDKDGTTLASSTYAFVIDEGSSNEEIVIADCTGTACVRVERGISARTGNTEVTALKKAHRRGASVKITDAPILMLVARALRGEDVTDFTPAGNGSLATKDYVDSIALGAGAVPATLTDDGIVELSTGLQAASSTATDQSGSPLTLHTGISTSTGGKAYTIPVTGSAGTIDDVFLSSNTQLKYINATSGEAISGATLPVPVYASTTNSKYYKSDANVDSKFNVIGFAISNTSGENEVIKIQTGGVVTGFSGLSTGMQYYLSDTVGTISTTTGTYTSKVGVAISTTTLLIKTKPVIFFTAIGTTDTGNAGAYVDSVVTTGFRPVKVTMVGYASPVTAGYATSHSYFLNGGNLSYGLGDYTGTVISVTDTGFTLRATQNSTSPAAGTVFFIAESE